MPEIIPATLTPWSQDITGKKFGMLTAVRFVGFKEYRAKKIQMWEFLCECGNTSITYKGHIVNGHVKSCGCAHRHYLKSRYPTPGLTQRQKYQKHRTKRLEGARAYRIKNRDKIRKYVREHSDYYRIKSSERRAKIRLCAVNSVGVYRWVKQLKRSRGIRCYYCGRVIPSGKLEIDHVIPLIHNGEHSMANLSAACEHCNATKSDKLPSEWRREGQQILSL